MSELKKYKVSINGESYFLVGNEADDVVIKAASIIGNSMQSLAQANLQMDSKQIAVLVALKLAVNMLNQQENSAKLIDLVNSEMQNLA